MRGRRLPRTPAMLLTAAWVLAMALGTSSAAAATSDGYPRIVQVHAKSAARVSLDVVVPPLLAGTRLSPAAFSVTQNGRPRPVTSVTPLPFEHLRVMLVVDTTVSLDVLTAEEGAARDFLFSLPADAQAGVVAGGPNPGLVAAPSTDRAAAVRALIGLRQQLPDSVVDVTPAMGVAVGALPPGRGANVLVTVDAHPATATVPYDLSRATLGAGTTVFEILLAPGPTEYLGRLAETSGGRVIHATAAGGLVSAYDTVAAELTGRYRVTFTTSGSEQGRLTVSGDGTRSTAGFSIGSGPPSPARRAEPAAAILAGILVGLAGGALLVGRISTPAKARLRPPTGGPGPQRQDETGTVTSTTSPPSARTATLPAPPGTSTRSSHRPGAAKNRNSPAAELTTSAVNSPPSSSSRT